MKNILIFFFFVSVVFPSLSFADCPETSAAKQAIQARNDSFLETYNEIIPDPEDDREALGSCLESVAAIGDTFSMGVTIPSLDTLLNALCDQLKSALQDKIDEAISDMDAEVLNFGFDGGFQINPDIEGEINNLVKKIK